MIAGRKRKPGPRHPSGDLVRDETPSPVQIKRAVAVAMLTARDASLGTQLGWMRLRQEITDAQMAAGLAFARLFLDYASAMSLPRRYAASASLEVSCGRGGGEEDKTRTSEARSRYRAASSKLSVLGDLPVVVSVCVDDNAPAWYERERLLRGLNIMVSHFHLDTTTRNRLGK